MNLDMNLEKIKKVSASSNCSQAFEWFKWLEKIPPIQFPSKYQVVMIPPHTMAIVRFLVRNPKNAKFVSVYLDCYDLLGCVGKPYWEIYPLGEHQDIERFAMEDVKSMMKSIRNELK